mgnify:CR=1 FL=1
MKTLKHTATLGLLLLSMAVFAKTITAKFTVKGQCGECKERIEEALDVKGISFAEWDVETKMLTVRYNVKKISEKEIHTMISKLGYATSQMEANTKAEKNLPGCCQPPKHSKKGSCCASKDACKPK